jgi:capsular exopolysaccharide synthesis family protein
VSDVREVLATLLRRIWSILLVTGLFVGAAVAFTSTRTPTYESTARVLVQAPTALQALGNAPASASVSLETERELVASTAVAQIAAEQLGSAVGARALLDHVSTSVPSNAQVLEITYTDPSPEMAQRGAQAFADAYLEFKTRRALDAFTNVRSGIQRQIQIVQEGLRDARAELESAEEGSPEQLQAQSEIDLLTSELAIYRNQMGTLTVFDIDPGEVIERADRPTSATFPDPVLNGLIALILGLGVGVAVALLRERLSDRLRGKGDLEESMRAPVLAVVPKIAGWSRQKRARLISLEAPKRAAAEAYRTLRTNLQFLARSADVRALLVTSPGLGAGTTTTVANLAVTLAQTGKRVMAVSCDLRSPRLHSFFGLSNAVGLTTILSGDASTEQATQPVAGVSGLLVIASGPVQPNPAEMLASEKMGALMAQLRDAADFVVIDTPPLLPVSDALVLVPWSDGVLVVADATSTTWAAALEGREHLEQVDSNVVGCVLNNFNPARAGRSADRFREHGDRWNHPKVRSEADDGRPADQAMWR